MDYNIREQIHNNSFISIHDMFNDLQEGELLTVKGGKGNKEIAAYKKENEIIYKREYNGEWFVYDPFKRLYEMSIQMLHSPTKQKHSIVQRIKSIFTTLNNNKMNS